MKRWNTFIFCRVVKKSMFRDYNSIRHKPLAHGNPWNIIGRSEEGQFSGHHELERSSILKFLSIFEKLAFSNAFLADWLIDFLELVEKTSFTEQEIEHWYKVSQGSTVIAQFTVKSGLKLINFNQINFIQFRVSYKTAPQVSYQKPSLPIFTGNSFLMAIRPISLRK